MTQRYTDPAAIVRMRNGFCPECGARARYHDGCGGPDGCTLTDDGVVQRLDEFRRAVMRTAFVVLAGLILATVTSALLGIWLEDGRWGLTTLVIGLLAIVAAGFIAALFDEVDR